MVEQYPAELDLVYRALADPTRRRMLRMLARSEHSISELAAPFAMSFAAASKHVSVLERAGLISRSIRGRTHVCRLESTPLSAAKQWITNCRELQRERLEHVDYGLDRPGPPVRTLIVRQRVNHRATRNWAARRPD
jgi:DNA-binding transcriptional ArsR family regulator